MPRGPVGGNLWLYAKLGVWRRAPPRAIVDAMGNGRLGFVGLCFLLACTETSDPADDGVADGSGSTTAPLSMATAEPGQSSTGDPAASSSSEGDGVVDESSGDATGPGMQTGLLASATFVIPAGSTVEEYSFNTTTLFDPGSLDGRALTVNVTDISHPERDQAALCPGNHPLDGCATVDYGAFGTTHDNRVSFEGADGPLSVHLYKDRSLQPEPEDLPVNE